MKRVLLTGASSGIGRAICERLLSSGHSVWGTSRDESRLPSHERFHPVELDLTQVDRLRPAVESVLDASGGVDVLINNAGLAVFGPIESISQSQLEDQFQLLVFAPMEIVRTVLPGMRERGGGTVINMSSLAAQFPVPFMGPYSAAKAALSALTWSLQMELCNTPVRMVDLQPGDIDTRFNETFVPADLALAPEYLANCARARRVFDAHTRSGPPAELIARAVSKIIESREAPPPVIYCGDLFQSVIAPGLVRFVPQSWVREVTRRYYRLKRSDG